MFPDLIQDNPGYDLIPPGPLMPSSMVDPCATDQDIDLTIYDSDQEMDTTGNAQQVICDDFVAGFINDADQSVDQPDQSVNLSDQGITPALMGEFLASFADETTGEATLVSDIGGVEDHIPRRNISLDASIPKPAPEPPEENVPFNLFIQPKGSQRKKSFLP